jgi:hypothetical protein
MATSTAKCSYLPFCTPYECFHLRRGGTRWLEFFNKAGKPIKCQKGMVLMNIFCTHLIGGTFYHRCKNAISRYFYNGYGIKPLEW